MAFEAFLKQEPDESRPKKWRRFTYALSLSLHAALLMGATARSFWEVDELQPHRVAVHFLAAYVPPPPALPPAAPARAAVQVPPPKPIDAPRPKPVALVEPTPVPEPAPQPETDGVADEETDDEEDVGQAEGDPNAQGPGDPAGVAGGDSVVAVVPVPTPAPAPPPEINLTPGTGTQLRTTDVNDPRYRPTLPPALNRNGMVVAGLFRICVAPDGHVKAVSIMKSADPLVDQAWSEVIRTWEYRPYSIGGQAVSFCHAARIEVRAQS